MDKKYIKKNQYNVPKKVVKKKVDKNTIYAFILLAFFIFWTIGSVLAICAFSGKKKNNIVSASANVVNDFANQNALNECDFMIKSPFRGNVGTMSAQVRQTNGEYYARYDVVSYTTDVQVVCDFEWLYSDIYVSEHESYFISFFVPNYSQQDSSDIGFAWAYDDTFEQDSFYHSFVDGGCIFWNTIQYEFGRFYLTFIDIDADYDFVIYDNISIKKYPSYSGYDYTLEELRAIYEKELLAAYNEGLANTEGYNQGYDVGYNQALDDIYATLQGIFSFSTWDVKVNQVTSNNITYNGFEINRFRSMRFVNRQTVNFTESVKQAFREMNLIDELVDYSSNSVLFTCYDFTEVIPQFMRFTLNLGTAFTLEDVQRYFDDICFIDSNNQAYWATFELLSDSSYLISFDFSSMLQGAYLQRMELGFQISTLLYTSVMISDNGVDYGLGYDSGYREGYSSALQNYDYELNQKYEEGVKYGDEVGYIRGFNKGVESANEYTFSALISSVVDVPIRSFTSLFNFEVLGVNLANFFFALMTIALILAIVKLIL